MQVTQAQVAAGQGGRAVIDPIRTECQGARRDGQAPAYGQQLPRRRGVAGIGQGVRCAHAAGDAVGADIHASTAQGKINRLARIARQVPAELAAALGQADLGVGVVVVTHLCHVVAGGVAIDRTGRADAHDQRVVVHDVVIACRDVGARQFVVACGQVDGARQGTGIGIQRIGHPAIGTHAGARNRAGGRNIGHRLPAHKAIERGAGIACVVGQADKLGIVVDHGGQGLGRDGGGPGLVVAQCIAQFGDRIGRQCHVIAHHSAAAAQHIVVARGIAGGGVAIVQERDGGQFAHALRDRVAIFHAGGTHVQKGLGPIDHRLIDAFEHKCGLLAVDGKCACAQGRQVAGGQFITGIAKAPAAAAQQRSQPRAVRHTAGIQRGTPPAAHGDGLARGHGDVAAAAVVKRAALCHGFGFTSVQNDSLHIGAAGVDVLGNGQITRQGFDAHFATGINTGGVHRADGQAIGVDIVDAAHPHIAGARRQRADVVAGIGERETASA